jgi:low affinity Fe/Cu permease
LVKYFDKYYADRAALNKGNDSASVNAFITIAHDQTKSLRQKRDALEQYLNEGE